MRGSLSFRLGAIMLVGFVLLQLLLVVVLQLPGRNDDRGYYGLPSPPALPSWCGRSTSRDPRAARG